VNYSEGLVTSAPVSASRGRPLDGHCVLFAGRLLTIDRQSARALAAVLGALTTDELTEGTTMVVVGAARGGRRAAAEADGHPGESAAVLKRLEQWPDSARAGVRVVSEDEFCDLAGIPSPASLRRQFHAQRDLLERYPHLREDHLRYLRKWGLVRPAHETHSETFYAFRDLGVLRQAETEMAAGATFRATLKALLAEQAGQLAFDFRLDAAPARVVQLKPREVPPLAALMNPGLSAEASTGEALFMAASILDDGDEAHVEAAADAYRRALVADPYLVPALINLANLHYSSGEMAEAQALYERAASLEPDAFEAYYNLGNIHHDLGRYPEAQRSYREALRLNPAYADAHFYLAVSLEKTGQSPDARPHWRAYQQLAPDGEWVALAREFSDPS